MSVKCLGAKTLRPILLVKESRGAAVMGTVALLLVLTGVIAIFIVDRKKLWIAFNVFKENINPGRSSR